MKGKTIFCTIVMEGENKDITSKTSEKEVVLNAKVAPTNTEKPTETSGTEGDAPKAEDIDDALVILNTMDELSGGKGGISAIPEELKGSVGYLIEKLKFVREMYEDPDWQAVMDDLADQREDGAIPSVKVAIARTMPLDSLQELADNEDYAGAQNELSNNLSQKKSAEEEEVMYQERFDKMMGQAQEYADEMNYDEDRKNKLLQKIFDVIKIFSDDNLSKAEFAEFDKMINYDTDTAALKEQVSAQDTKEVLPDQASLESGVMSSAPKAPPVGNAPGLGSMAGVGTQPAYLQTGRSRFNKK